MVVELTYLLRAHEVVSVQPDLQLVLNPAGGAAGSDLAVALGARLTVEL